MQFTEKKEIKLFALKGTTKYYLNHFLIILVVIILIVKNVLEIIKFMFVLIYTKRKNILRNRIVSLKKLLI